ncbi:MAG: hypothetical protein PWP27_2243 [Clostridiales bacterium]|jgi:sensor histidine kinase regulating citrate/malate metabolism|nr:hypothetical protein [Clostridiales bacterium]MDK2934433.1 hypothetical protein [Clostridiales bacterium]
MNDKHLKKNTIVIILVFIIQGILSLSFVNASIWGGLGNLNFKMPLFIIIVGNILPILYIWMIKRIVQSLNKEIEFRNVIIKLKESNEIISFLRIHKHDFFNHLQVIRGLAQMNNTQRIISYIDSIVEKVDSAFNIAKIAVPEIAVVIMQKIGEASNKSIKVNVEINTSLECLKGNPVDYSQILFNLLDNAITALEHQENANKKLDIVIDEDNQNYYFIIENNWPIIPPDVQNKIFDKGFTTKENGDGGMGLYIVKTLVNKYRGIIYVTSEEGLGTSFEVVIPKCPLPILSI